MSLVNVDFPYQYVADNDRNKAVASGYIYIGEPDLDPEIIANQKTIYFVQEDGNEVVGAQPIRTSAGGVPTYNGSPVAIKTEGDYSIKILDKNSVQVYYSPNSNVSEALLNALQTVGTLAELPAAADNSGRVRYVEGVGHFKSDGANWNPIDRPLTPQMFGFVDGGDVTENTTAFQLFLDATGDLYVPDADYVLDSQVVIKSNTTLTLSDNAYIRRAWAGNNSDRPANCTIKNENAPSGSDLRVDPGPYVPASTDSNIRIIGGRWGHLDDDAVTYRGGHIGLMFVYGGELSGLVFETQQEEWNTELIIFDFTINDILFNVLGTGGVRNDGIHITGGSRINISDIRGGVDDDLIALGSNYNQGISDVTINGISCKTNRNFLKIFQDRAGSTAAFGNPTEEIKRITVDGVNGICGGTGTGYLDIFTGDTSYKTLLKDITISNVNLELGTSTDETNTISVDINGGVNIKLENFNLRAPIRSPLTAANVTELEVVNFKAEKPSKASQRAIQITDCTGVEIYGGEVEGNGVLPVDITDSNVIIDGAVVRGSRNAGGAVVLDGAVSAIIRNLTPIRESGATTSNGVQVASGATINKLIVYGGDYTSVDRNIDLKQSPSVDGLDVEGIVPKYGDETISAGGTAVYRGFDVIAVSSNSSGNPDDLVSISNAPKGAIVEIRPADYTTEPITAKTTNFTLQGGVDFVMNTASSSLTMRSLGGNKWIELSRVT